MPKKRTLWFDCGMPYAPEVGDWVRVIATRKSQLDMTMYVKRQAHYIPFDIEGRVVSRDLVGFTVMFYDTNLRMHSETTILYDELQGKNDILKFVVKTRRKVKIDWRYVWVKDRLPASGDMVLYNGCITFVAGEVNYNIYNKTLRVTEPSNFHTAYTPSTREGPPEKFEVRIKEWYVVENGEIVDNL